MHYIEGGPTGEQKNAPHNQIFSSIDNINTVRPEDRIGRLFNQEGINTPEDIRKARDYVVDIQLWDFGSKDFNRAKLDEVIKFIKVKQGKVTDEHIDEGLILLRVKCKGILLCDLTSSISSIAIIDLPPQPSLTVHEQLNLSIKDFPKTPPPSSKAQSVAVLDSGVTSAHPLLKTAIGESTSIPRSVGNGDDINGHGTMVSGLALYGDVGQSIQARIFTPKVKIYSAKVLNDSGRFDDENLITTQMREAISYFKNQYNCRVFNLSLGDSRLPYKNGKVSYWAAILDTLCRELDIVIVVSAGNIDFDLKKHGSAANHFRRYPKYLLHDDSRIIEPATGAIVLTVGSLSHSANVPVGSASSRVSLRPFALPGQPSPFTRSGPGLGNSIKPDLCEFGGNFAYDGLINSINQRIAELSVVSLNNEYLNRLFSTNIGTSFAAPKIAHIAARLFESFPHASSNLIRALLAASAVTPDPAMQLLKPHGKDAHYRICGYGHPRFEFATNSDINRMMLFNDASIKYDHFHIYQVPIPEEFVKEKGTKTIGVTLAFDPPVRHTRFDYLGVTMSFRLIRGKSIKEVAEAFRKRSKEEGKVDTLTSTTYHRKMVPASTMREGGTLQKGSFSTKMKFKPQYGENYFLVIRCEKKWALEEVYGPQRYAVVVNLEHSEPLDLYTRIRQRVRVPVRVRARH